MKQSLPSLQGELLDHSTGGPLIRRLLFYGTKGGWLGRQGQWPQYLLVAEGSFARVSSARPTRVITYTPPCPRLGPGLQEPGVAPVLRDCDPFTCR